MAKRTRRVRHEPPKVWHNPDVVSVRGAPKGSAKVEGVASTPPATALDRGARAGGTRGGRIVALRSTARDERELERERLISKLRAAEGRNAISRAAEELFQAGFDAPADDQHVHLQLLEHQDELRVRAALTRLADILDQEPAQRFAVLDSRLRRLQELADDAETRTLAGQLRRLAAPQ